MEMDSEYIAFQTVSLPHWCLLDSCLLRFPALWGHVLVTTQPSLISPLAQHCWLNSVKSPRACCGGHGTGVEDTFTGRHHPFYKRMTHGGIFQRCIAGSFVCNAQRQIYFTLQIGLCTRAHTYTHTSETKFHKIILLLSDITGKDKMW